MVKDHTCTLSSLLFLSNDPQRNIIYDAINYFTDHQFLCISLWQFRAKSTAFQSGRDFIRTRCKARGAAYDRAFQ